MTQTIYLTNAGGVRLDAAPDLIKITCTQQQYEAILSTSIYQEYCLTPLKNFEKYKENDKLKTEDIPTKCEFDFPDDEFSDSNFTEEQLKNFFIQDNKEMVIEAFEEELEDNSYYIDGKIIKCSLFDRYNLQLMTSQNKPFYFNGVFYSSEELKHLYHSIENEIMRIAFYKEVLLKLCDALTLEDKNNRNFIEWGIYNEKIDKEMQKYEQPFE